MLRKVLISFGIIILPVVAFFSWYGIKAKSEIKKMTTVQTGEITDGVYSIKDSFTNVYLVKDSNSFIAIDAGNNAEAIAEGLKMLNVNTDLVVAVLLTHTDGDHVAAIDIFPHATIYISEQEEQMINGETSRFMIFGNKLCTENYTLVKDQQTFNIGNLTIKGILTEGHTPGSMCYVINDNYLFTGDLLSLKEGKINKFNEFFNMDTETSVKSMDKIVNLSDIEYIFTSHYGYTDDYQKAVEDWGK